MVNPYQNPPRQSHLEAEIHPFSLVSAKISIKNLGLDLSQDQVYLIDQQSNDSLNGDRRSKMQCENDGNQHHFRMIVCFPSALTIWRIQSCSDLQCKSSSLDIYANDMVNHVYRSCSAVL